MKLYRNESTDPYFNLAAEEVLLDTEDEEVFMLWQDDRSVILGRNQNAYAEINRPFVEEHGIAVVRRLTGGGAVFHDLGNVNFTFIVSRESCPELDFGRFCLPVVQALRSLGVPAELSGRNDLVAEGRKFSGNAQCVHKGKVLHHGTLLCSSDVSSMAGALRVDEEKMKSKGIRSVQSRVCNLSEYLPDLDARSLKGILEERIAGERGSRTEATAFSPEQREAILRLRQEKYTTWEWNYGVSGEYARTVKKHFPFGTVELAYTAEHGVLTDLRFLGDYFGTEPVGELEASLTGCRLDRGELTARLAGADRWIHGADPGELAALFLL